MPNESWKKNFSTTQNIENFQCFELWWNYFFKICFASAWKWLFFFKFSKYNNKLCQLSYAFWSAKKYLELAFLKQCLKFLSKSDNVKQIWNKNDFFEPIRKKNPTTYLKQIFHWSKSLLTRTNVFSKYSAGREQLSAIQ